MSGQRCIALCLSLALLLCAVTAAASVWDQYVDHVNLGIEGAKEAASLFNSGRSQRAQLVARKALTAFEAAEALLPERAEAWLAHTQFLLNMNRFEDALRVTQQAEGLVQDAEARGALTQRRNTIAYGQAASERDAAYAAGNVTRALAAAREQLALFPRAPNLMFDLGTLLVSVGAVNASLANEAIEWFVSAQHASLLAWAAGLHMSGEAACGSGNVVRDWTEWAAEHDGAVRMVHKWTLPSDAEREYGGSAHMGIVGAPPDADFAWPSFVQGDAHVIRFEDATLAGRDGLIMSLLPDSGADAAEGTTECAVFPPAIGGYMDFTLNLRLLSSSWMNTSQPQWYNPYQSRLTDAGPMPQQAPEAVRPVSNVASIIGWATTSYYHWLVEGLVRVLMLQPLLEEDATLRLLVPRDTESLPSVGQWLRLLPLSVTEDRLLRYDAHKVGYPGPRLKVNGLVVPNWDPVSHGDHDAHSVPPGYWIQRLHDAFSAHYVPLQERYSSQYIVLIRRPRHVRMRHLDNEPEVEAAFTSVATSMGFDVRIFEEPATKVDEDVLLFSGAHAVIGVHGGALANTVFCRPGTVVMELGFASFHTRHYYHIAAALGLRYHLVLLEPTQRGVSAQQVALSPTSLQGAVDILSSALKPQHDEL